MITASEREYLAVRLVPYAILELTEIDDGFEPGDERRETRTMVQLDTKDPRHRKWRAWVLNSRGHRTVAVNVRETDVLRGGRFHITRSPADDWTSKTMACADLLPMAEGKE